MESVNGLMVGDHVTIVLEKDLLADLQLGHGDWVPGMVEDIGHIGVIRDFTVEQDVVVEYPQRRRKWIFHPAALTKVEKFRVGDSVSITADLINTLKIQLKHAMSNKQLQESIGKLATVVEVDETGSYQIQLDEAAPDWLHWVNPVMLQAAARGSLPSGSKSDSSQGSGNVREMIKDVSKRIGLVVMEDVSDELAIQAAKGNLDAVQRLILLHPDWVNVCREHKTALQLASHGGFMEVIQALLEAKADVDIKDEDGDTALMYAIYGNHPVIVDYLLVMGADINGVNNEHRSSLHQAVTRGYLDCVQMLFKFECNVNIQDNFGDTALHDAISGNNNEILALFIANPKTNFRLSNKRQFNALQWASLKGNQYAINTIILKDSTLAKIPNEEGLTPLHIAAMNNFPDIVRILLVKGYCDINRYSKDQQTPLLLAVRAGHVEVIEVLLTLGADVNLADADGDTSLYVALLRQVIFPDVTNTILLQKIQARIPDQSVATSGLALACLLLENKADLSHMNNKGQTALDIVPDAKIHAVLRHFIPHTISPRSSGGHRVEEPFPLEGDSQPMSEHIRMQSEKEAKFLAKRQTSSDASTPTGRRKSGADQSPNKEEPVVRQLHKEQFSQPSEGVPRQPDETDKREKFGSPILGDMPFEDASRTQATRSDAIEPLAKADTRTPRPEPEHMARQLAKEAQFSPLRTPSTSFLGEAGAGDATPPRRGLAPLKLPPRGQPFPPTGAGAASAITPSPHPISYMTTPTPTTLPPNLARCRLGCGKVADTQFMPCGHTIVCQQCSECFKLCHECRNVVKESVVQLSRAFEVITNADPGMGQQAAAAEDASSGNGIHYSDQDLTKSVLIQKNRKLAEELECGVCLSKRKEFVFMCGHSLCHQCTESMDECPYCRAVIQKKIKMY